MNVTRPNILLVTTDQQRADHLGVKGLRAIGTPHLDRLAREGVHFDRAYCPSPICTPTRLSLLTGQYPSRHGGYSIGMTPAPFPVPLFTRALHSAGYHLALFGKHHFVARPDETSHILANSDAKTEDEAFSHGPCRYLDFDEFQGSRGHTINSTPAQHYKAFLKRSGVDYSSWFRLGLPNYDHFRSGPWEIPVEYHDTTWVADLAEDYISRRAASGQPWFCWASFQDPHEPFVCPEPWYSRVDTSQLPLLPSYREGEFDDRPDPYRRTYKDDWGPYHDPSGVPCVFAKPEWEARRAVAMQATLGMIGFIDHRVGTILARLETTGQLDRTIVIFTSDHGEMHGHHGLWGKGALAYEDCQRVPLLMWAPGRIKNRGTVASLANLVDLPATCLDLAGIEKPVHMQGVSLRPVLTGDASELRDAVLIECHATTNLASHTLVTQTHKLVVWRGLDKGELYDLQSDPDQYRNLWSDPTHQTLKTELLCRLARLHIEEEGKKPVRKTFG